MTPITNAPPTTFTRATPSRGRAAVLACSLLLCAASGGAFAAQLAGGAIGIPMKGANPNTTPATNASTSKTTSTPWTRVSTPKTAAKPASAARK